MLEGAKLYQKVGYSSSCFPRWSKSGWSDGLRHGLGCEELTGVGLTVPGDEDSEAWWG